MHSNPERKASLSRTLEQDRARKKLDYLLNPEKYRERSLAWRHSNYEKYLWCNAKKNAKEHNREFNLTTEDIKIPEVCPVLGIPLIRNTPRAKDNSPSIDRIDHTKGYVKGNVQVISWRANDLKANGSLEEFRRLVKWLEDGTKEKKELQERDSLGIHAGTGVA